MVISSVPVRPVAPSSFPHPSAAGASPIRSSIIQRIENRLPPFGAQSYANTRDQRPPDRPKIMGRRCRSPAPAGSHRESPIIPWRMRLPVHGALRYVQPLREGGSLPAIVDTEAGLFVVKFRGAGQGPKALIAELIVGLLAQRLGFPVPDPALIQVAPAFGRAEPDPENQEILPGSHGINVGARYLDGAFNFDPHAAGEYIPPSLASELVWFDGYTTNPDRTHRNPNILIWQRKPWLIDHGAAIYAHHSWATVDAERTRTAFPLIKD